MVQADAVADPHVDSPIWPHALTMFRFPRVAEIDVPDDPSKPRFTAARPQEMPSLLEADAAKPCSATPTSGFGFYLIPAQPIGRPAPPKAERLGG